jgi:hypothetical protein
MAKTINKHGVTGTYETDTAAFAAFRATWPKCVATPVRITKGQRDRLIKVMEDGRGAVVGWITVG